jgi:hypothetical protein
VVTSQLFVRSSKSAALRTSLPGERIARLTKSNARSKPMRLESREPNLLRIAIVVFHPVGCAFDFGPYHQ